MKVLIFKVNQLGDNIVFLPVVQELRRRFPTWDLAIFTSPIAEPLYQAAVPDPTRRLIESTDRFNGSWKRPVDLWRLSRRIAAFGPDACLVADDQANAADLLAFLSRAPLRATMERPFLKLRGLATISVPAQAHEKVATANWRMGGALVTAVGEKGWPIDPPPPDLTHLITAKVARSKACEVVIHSGASRSYQCWFQDRYVELANRLAALEGVRVTWIEVPGAAKLELSPMVRQVKTPRLSDLAQALHGIDLFIGNNSGPMHMANALACPCVIINGPTTRHWDPAWHAERMLMLRDETLPCLPCDSVSHPANVCRRISNPMACMKFWTVDAILARSLEWARRWRGFTSDCAFRS